MPETDRLSLLATAAFGLEGVAAAELRRLGMDGVTAAPGGARFSGSPLDAVKANFCLRCADRVLIVLAEAEARSFEALFQLAQTAPWEKLLPRDGRIHVSGKCVRSQLMSVRDCQAIVKKAVIERIRRTTGQQTFPETGADCPIDVSIHGDAARITLDTSGEALNRRGYRTWNGEAPLRETLAAALVALSTWRPGLPLYDPCCGTGTLLVEAAWRAMHRAPGLTRRFAWEAYGFFPKEEAEALRRQLETEILPERCQGIAGSDIDPEALTLAERHVRQAGLEGKIALRRQALETLQLEGPPGVFLCNPPYGERLSDRESCRRLYGELALLQKRHPRWDLCVISSDPGFERAFGRRAAKKRRLYNGRLECEFMIFPAYGKPGPLR